MHQCKQSRVVHFMWKLGWAPHATFMSKRENYINKYSSFLLRHGVMSDWCWFLADVDKDNTGLGMKVKYFFIVNTWLPRSCNTLRSSNSILDKRENPGTRSIMTADDDGQLLLSMSTVFLIHVYRVNLDFLPSQLHVIFALCFQRWMLQK